jgi:hypothetical protein
MDDQPKNNSIDIEQRMMEMSTRQEMLRRAMETANLCVKTEYGSNFKTELEKTMKMANSKLQEEIGKM